MSPERKYGRTAGRVLTYVFVTAVALGGIVELIGGPQAVEKMSEIHYPAYLLGFLGLAKLLAVAAILYGRYPRLKEWAYAGLTFDLLGAAYSHAMSGQAKAAAAPMVLLALGFPSHYYCPPPERSRLSGLAGATRPPSQTMAKQGGTQ